jgi:beta-galactosidase
LGKSSSAGVLDTCGFKKDGYYFYQSQWTTAPMLHLFPHWNWNGHEGKFQPVMCYTNCDTVELSLNGKSLGIKGYTFPRLGMEKRYGTFPARALVRRTTSDLHLAWDVPYEPGTLKAIGTRDGKVAVEKEITTTSEATSIDLTADRNNLIPNRRDVAHVTIQILDDLRRIVPDADNEIKFEVQGEGRLIGLDNGNPESHEDYKSNQRRGFHGLCLAIVQSSTRSGKIRLTATSPGLKPGNLTITTGA